jgi:hypothetical protein
MKSSTLCITSAALLVPFVFYMNNLVRDFVMDDLAKRRNILEDVLAAILFAAIYAAQWFWSNPVKDGLSHHVDGAIAKTTIVSFLGYIIYYKSHWNDYICIFAVTLLLFFAAMSHYSSSKEWCSESHLFWHGGLHLVGSLSAIYAFVDR